MPRSPRPRCYQSGCMERAAPKGGYCDQHRKKIQAEKSLTRERIPFYSSSVWLRLRDLVIKAEPLCRHCAKQGFVTPATCVDHIVPISQGGAKTDRVNLQPLCSPCHGKKSAGETLLKDRGK